jgi:hypothetical protein
MLLASASIVMFQSTPDPKVGRFTDRHRTDPGKQVSIYTRPISQAILGYRLDTLGVRQVSIRPRREGLARGDLCVVVVVYDVSIHARPEGRAARPFPIQPPL